ncbi:hypothetical protein E05_34700 [Plautia stali symbiont]|nr:hypothetical protein E05_34700 [Plautia stali symbiont]
MGDLDLLYYLIADFMDPYIDAINLKNSNSYLGDKVFDAYVEKIERL